MSEYDPNSTNAMFSRIMEKLERIEAQTEKTNGRVNSLEQWREVVTAKVTVIAAGISTAVGFVAWLISRFGS